jgi:hypothetical protein
VADGARGGERGDAAIGPIAEHDHYGRRIVTVVAGCGGRAPRICSGAVLDARLRGHAPILEE